SVEELRARERHWYDLLKPAINSYRPHTTEAEVKERNARWESENSDWRSKYYKNYREKHRDKLREYRADPEVAKRHRENHAAWRKANKDKVKASAAKHRAKMQPQQCPCGAVVKNLTQH